MSRRFAPSAFHTRVSAHTGMYHNTNTQTLTAPLLLRQPMFDVKNFTIFIKNSIRFPKFDVTR